MNPNINATVWLCPWCFWTDGQSTCGGRVLAMEQDHALVLHQKLNGEYAETIWLPWRSIEMMGDKVILSAQRLPPTLHAGQM